MEKINKKIKRIIVQNLEINRDNLEKLGKGNEWNRYFNF
jgi:hypothetical protein